MSMEAVGNLLENPESAALIFATTTTALAAGRAYAEQKLDETY